VSAAGPVSSKRTRYLGTAADLTVASVLALGSAAAGSRLLWPVLFIGAYYAIGVVLTGTSPMVALLRDRAPAPDTEPPPTPGAQSRVADAESRITSAESRAPNSGPRVRSAF
jgi:hypothetical protein